MSYLPCKNPNCHSYGKPHPNCKCYGEMAEGGDVRFCSEARMHQKGCEYFAEGGDVAPAFIPDEEAQSAAGAENTQDAPDFIPDDKADEAPDFIPDEGAGGVKEDDNINLSPAELQAKMVEKANPNGPSKYESPGQQLGTVAEGLAQGIAGPAATLAETELLDIPPEDIKGRQEANPWEHGLAETAGVAGSLATGIGEAGLIAKGAKVLPEYARLGKVGSAAIEGMITNGLLQAGDNASKAILGQGNPEDAVNPLIALGTSAFMGGAFGALGAKASGAVTSEANQAITLKEAAKVEQWLAGFGHASSGGELGKVTDASFDAGYKSFKGLPSKLSKVVGGWAGSHIPEVGETLGYLVGSKVIEPLMTKATNKAGKYAIPATVRWLSQGAQGSLSKMIDYANKVEKGTSVINNSIDALFKAGSQQAVNAYKPGDIDRLKSFIDDGDMIPLMKNELMGSKEAQNFAKGGDVSHHEKSSLHHDDHLAANLPEQNILIQTVKGRVSKYLAGMRPQEYGQKLPFDDDHDKREQEKNYDKALKIAAHPLSVMDHIQSGTIEPDHVKHLSSMYPELTSHLQQKTTERILKAQMDDQKPSYKVRQGLSLLMGVPLSGEMLPQNIQAAQAVFSNAAKQRASAQESDKKPPAKKTSSLSKSDQAYMTDDQAREERRQKP